MREIKFRGKTAEGVSSGYWIPRWVYGYYYVTDVTHYIATILHSDHKVDPETVGQYTGKKDKNDKEIYEGDVSNVSFYDNKPEKALIEWSDKLVGFTIAGYPMTIHGISELELIGNIHDNPDLLEEK